MDIKNIAGEFKTFVLKGNVVDLAVGVVIGGAFKSVVDAMVATIINPALALFGLAPKGVLNFGMMVQSVISFVAIALVVFLLVVKPMNILLEMAKKKAEVDPESAPVPDDVRLLTEIRDLLKAQKQPPVV